MLKGILLICSTAMTPNMADCTTDNAATFIAVPAEYSSVIDCQLRVQAYFAGTMMASWISPWMYYREKVRIWHKPSYQFKFTCMRVEHPVSELGVDRERLKREILESNRKRLLPKEEVLYTGGG